MFYPPSTPPPFRLFHFTVLRFNDNDDLKCSLNALLDLFAAVAWFCLEQLFAAIEDGRNTEIIPAVGKFCLFAFFNPSNSDLLIGCVFVLQFLNGLSGAEAMGT